MRGILFGWKGLVSAVAGCLLAGVIMFLFYAVRAMGAGDVKIMAALGALVGPHYVVSVLLATAIFGGLLGIAYAIYRGESDPPSGTLAQCCAFTPGQGCKPIPI